uniref:N-acetyltransferase domain-containing protein n=1 Tax=viral metagenome TaxID=1070528 RepID=A0A6C0KWX8_9ZZZZ
MSFRQLTPNDYNEYLKLINEFRPTEFSEDQFKITLVAVNKSSEIWVYEDNGELISTGTIIFEHKFIFNTCIYAHIEDICVKSSYRRKGLGKLLIKHLIERCKGCYKITLDCSNLNIQFYEACGFNLRGNQMCILLKN